MEIYEETANVVKIGEKYTEEFWTEMGVRQGCPLSPTLFNAYVADSEEEMRKGQVGGIVIGNRKIWTLIYADDIVLIADREEELKNMLRRFGKWLARKKMDLSAEKTKVLVFEKWKGKADREWKWGEEVIEEVKKMKYLGYILQKNENAERYIGERNRRAILAMRITWSLGTFKDDYRRRMSMFESLVHSVALFRAEAWG